MKYIWTTMLLATISLTSYARLQLPAIFSAKMILQRHQPIYIWGISDAGHTVSVFFHDIRVTAPAGPDGTWNVILPSMEAGGPCPMVISNGTGDSVSIPDVLVGEVWVCAGQSNMNFALAGDRSTTSVRPASFDNDSIREFRCDMPPGVLNPENGRHSRWIGATGDETHNFSAVAYYFAGRLQRSLHVPVGIVIMACGATRAESWTNPDLLTERFPDKDVSPNTKPGLFYTNVVRPVAGYPARGLVWYQGESNTLPDNSGRTIGERAGEYRSLLERLIGSFRMAWGNERWPVVLVQLPNYKDPSGDIQWARIRQSQLEVSRETPHVLLAVTIDVGDSTNIHPDHKRPVGERAARLALTGIYGERSRVETSGPLAKKAMITNSGIVIYFDHAGRGLKNHQPAAGGGLPGFEIAGPGDPTRFIPAFARIRGDHVVVRPAATNISQALDRPLYIRYAWSDNPLASLFNGDGLPASPFLLSVTPGPGAGCLPADPGDILSPHTNNINYKIMNRLRTFTISLALAMAVASPCIMGVACKKSGGSVAGSNDTTVIAGPIQTLPARQAKVYIGFSDRWHEMADPANYSQWSFVRSHAAGFYTNFIAMWINNYQNSEDPQQSCADMYNAFAAKGSFFETSLETKVNDDPTGGNNESTDKKYMDQLITAGFSVDYASLNYGIDPERVNTLRTYHGARSCLTLAGPWLVGGNILTDTVSGNAQIRSNILATDGMETDGPLGLWSVNSGNMQTGSYSLVHFADGNNKTAAVMLAPSDGGITSYNPDRDFLTVSKQCVLGHEDNYASPDLWTIWTYGELPDEPTFPESMTDSAGHTAPANTMAGVGYWLLRHLTDLPKAVLTETGAVNASVNVQVTDSLHAQVNISKGSDGARFYALPVTFSNDNDPAIELSPVIHAVLGGDQKDWTVSFTANGADVTDAIVYKGGFNCVRDLRLDGAHKLVLTINIKANTAAAPPGALIIKLESMSNISETQTLKTVYTAVANAL